MTQQSIQNRLQYFGDFVRLFTRVLQQNNKLLKDSSHKFYKKNVVHKYNSAIFCRVTLAQYCDRYINMMLSTITIVHYCAQVQQHDIALSLNFPGLNNTPVSAHTALQLTEFHNKLGNHIRFQLSAQFTLVCEEYIPGWANPHKSWLGFPIV